MLTLGVEEEYYVVDPADRSLVLTGLLGLDALQQVYTGMAGFDHEFQLSIVESRTSVCDGLQRVSDEVRSLRGRLLAGAAASGSAIVSAGTMPLANWSAV